MMDLNENSLLVKDYDNLLSRIGDDEAILDEGQEESKMQTEDHNLFDSHDPSSLMTENLARGNNNQNHNEQPRNSDRFANDSGVDILQTRKIASNIPTDFFQ